MKERLKSYLPPDAIHEGIKLCLQNVQDILFDCKLLFKKKRYSRVMALSITTLEEIGKIKVLRTINRIPKSRQKLISKKWDAFYDHQYKSTLGFVTSYPDFLRKNIESFTLTAINQFINAPFCEDARQLGLYTDYSKNDKCWISPRMITKELATLYYKIAIMAFNRINHFLKIGLFSRKALEIEKDVYKDILKDVSDTIENIESLEIIINKAPEKTKEYFNRLIIEGVIKETDIHNLLENQGDPSHNSA